MQLCVSVRGVHDYRFHMYESFSYSRNFLRKKEIEIIPSGGYKNADNQSREAMQWLVWMERKLGQRIIHAGTRGREYRVEGILVDGYYDDEQRNATLRISVLWLLLVQIMPILFLDKSR